MRQTRLRRSIVCLLGTATVGSALTTLAAAPTAAVGLSANPIEVRTTFRPNPVDRARAVAVDADGTSFFAGEAGGDFGLIRSGSDYYSNFGTDGRVTADFDGRDDVANAVVTSGDDGAVLAGASSGDIAVLEVDDQGFPSAVFGVAGRVLTDLGGDDDAAYGLARLPDGRTLVAGGNSAAAVLLRYRPDGSLDPTFGSGGIVTAGAAGPWRALAVQPDGKLVVGGGGKGMVVARYLPDGSPDTSFGTGGRTVLLPGDNTMAHAVGVFADNTIVLAGGRDGDIALARVSAAGVPVPTFGVGGAVVDDLGSQETAYGLALSSDGVITVVGEHGSVGFAGSFLPTGQPNPAAGPTGIAFTNAGYDPWGQRLRAVVPNPSWGFSVAGSVNDDFYTGRFFYGNGSAGFSGGPSGLDRIPESANRAVRQPDGKVIIAGETGGMLGMVRHNADTTLDPTYGHGGRVVSDLISQPRGLALDAAGRTVVAGLYRGKLALLRFTPQGALDPTFGTGGRSVSETPTERLPPAAVLALPGGKILVVGGASGVNGMGGWVARLNPDGSPDLGFGAAGSIIGAFKGFGTTLLVRLVLQNDGKVLIAGYENVLTRLNLDGTRDAGFGTDGSVAVGRVGALDGLSLLPDGRILVGSTALAYGEHKVTRLLPDGREDPDWRTYRPGVDGQVVIPLADGRVLAVAGSGGRRFLSNGDVDNSFGDAGRMVLTEGSASPVDAFLEPDGTLLIAGGDRWPAEASFTFARSRTGMPGMRTPATWGWGPQGELGDGTTAYRPAPAAAVGLTDVASVAAGTYHTLALRTDGTVWAWGWNGLGQLGDGTTLDRTSPVKVAGLDGTVSISAGAGHSLAVKSDGSVWAWGWNAYGQLGDGTTVDRHSPVRVFGPSGFVSVAAGAVHSLALSQGGSVAGWGWNGVGQLGDGTSMDRHSPVMTLGLEGPYWRYNIRGISAGAYHSLAVSDLGAVLAWGWNGVGQLGDGTTLERHLPVPLSGVGDVRMVSAGWVHSLAVLSDGTVRAWGWNAVGQLGDGTNTDRHSPVPVVGLTDVRSASAGAFHSLGVRMDGLVRAWGWNGTGALGTGGTGDSWVPVRVPVTGAAVGSAGGIHSVVS